LEGTGQEKRAEKATLLDIIPQ